MDSTTRSTSIGTYVGGWGQAGVGAGRQGRCEGEGQGQWQQQETTQMVECYQPWSASP